MVTPMAMSAAGGASASDHGRVPTPGWHACRPVLLVAPGQRVGCARLSAPGWGATARRPCQISMPPTFKLGRPAAGSSAQPCRSARGAGHLRVVLAWRTEPRAFSTPSLAPQELAGRQQRVRDRLAATVRAVLGPERAAEVTTEVTEGSPERALVDSSAGADLLVLGAASGQLAGRSIGPVVRTCLSRAHCPVVVVGPEGWGLPGRDSASPANLVADAGDGWKLVAAGAVAAPRGGD
jgi:nucleotide-binding universal stress UspA family protein